MINNTEFTQIEYIESNVSACLYNLLMTVMATVSLYIKLSSDSLPYLLLR